MDNITYIRDSRNQQEAALVNGVARFQMSIGGVVSRSDLVDGEWSSYRPIPRSVRDRTDFYNYMITVAQHASTSRETVDSFTSDSRVLIHEGIVMHVGVNGDRMAIGYQVDPSLNEQIPKKGRAKNGWYPLGPEASIVPAFISHAFPAQTVKAARDEIRKHFPDLSHHFEDSPSPMRPR